MKRKNLLRLLLGGMLVSLLLVGVSSCAEDPDEQELFIGAYKGKVTYSGGDTHISKNNGTVTIVKVGTRHDFLFSDGIPSIKNVKMEGNNGKFHGSISTEEVSVISIEDGHLKLNYVKGTLDEVWTADCRKN